MGTIGIKLSRMRRNLLKPFLAGNKYTCNLCNMSYRKFLGSGQKKHGFDEPHKEVIGLSYKPNNICPNCGSKARVRSVWQFLKQTEGLLPIDRLLHVSPNRQLKEKLIEQEAVNSYYVGGLEQDSELDITAIEYEDNFFDAIICNHVLEHVVDDFKGMKELYRVLKSGGWAILQVPFKIQHNTQESIGVDFSNREMPLAYRSKKTLEIRHGHPDHLRTYGVGDYTKRLREAGFTVDVRHLLDETDENIHALDPLEPIFFCRKL